MTQTAALPSRRVNSKREQDMARRLFRTVVALGLVGGALMASSPVAEATDNYPCGAQWFNPRVGLNVQTCPDWSPNGWIPVFDSNGLGRQIKSWIYAPGNDWYVCEASGGVERIGNFWNSWWAWTMADDGQWGWVNEVNFQGGGNDEPDATLVRC
jgi:hypothetical protein